MRYEEECDAFLPGEYSNPGGDGDGGDGGDDDWPSYDDEWPSDDGGDNDGGDGTGCNCSTTVNGVTVNVEVIVDGENGGSGGDGDMPPPAGGDGEMPPPSGGDGENPTPPPTGDGDSNPGECQDNDNGAVDSYGDPCNTYQGNLDWCGQYDTNDFNSGEMCCACGGGTGGANPD